MGAGHQLKGQSFLEGGEKGIINFMTVFTTCLHCPLAIELQSTSIKQGYLVTEMPENCSFIGLNKHLPHHEETMHREKQYYHSYN